MDSNSPMTREKLVGEADGCLVADHIGGDLVAWCAGDGKHLVFGVLDCGECIVHHVGCMHLA